MTRLIFSPAIFTIFGIFEDTERVCDVVTVSEIFESSVLLREVSGQQRVDNGWR